MNDVKAAEATHPNGERKSIERLILGDDSISGTLRLIGYIVAFAVVFGSLFHFLLG